MREMGVDFIFIGVLGFIVTMSFALVFQSLKGVKNIQPSVRLILMFWKEESGVKKTLAFFEFYFLCLVLIGVVCGLIDFDFDDFPMLGFVIEIAVFFVPIFLYSKVIGFYKE